MSDCYRFSVTLAVSLTLAASTVFTASCYRPSLRSLITDGGQQHPHRADITSEPAEANVSIDGQTQGATPWQGQVDVGRHVLVLGGVEGHRTIERTLRIHWNDQYSRRHVRIPGNGHLDYRFFNLQLVMQGAVGVMGEYTGSGGGFQGLARFLFTVAKIPMNSSQMLLDIGLEAGGGFFSLSSYSEEFIGYDSTRYRLDESFLGKGLVGLFVGVNIPIVVRARPILWATANTTLGVGFGDGVAFRWSIAAGLSVSATDALELRFELLSFDMFTYDLSVSECDRSDSGSCSWDDTNRRFTLAHFTPAFVLSFRFR